MSFNGSIKNFEQLRLKFWGPQESQNRKRCWGLIPLTLLCRNCIGGLWACNHHTPWEMWTWPHLHTIFPPKFTHVMRKWVQKNVLMQKRYAFALFIYVNWCKQMTPFGFRECKTTTKKTACQNSNTKIQKIKMVVWHAPVYKEWHYNNIHIATI